LIYSQHRNEPKCDEEEFLKCIQQPIEFIFRIRKKPNLLIGYGTFLRYIPWKKREKNLHANHISATIVHG